MARSKVTPESIPAEPAVLQDDMLPDAPEEIFLDLPVEQIIEEAPPSEEEIEEAMREHIRFMTRGWVPGPETAFVAPQQSEEPVEIIEPKFTCEDWVSFNTDESKALMDGFKHAAKAQGLHYGTPSYWRENFTRWISSPA